VTVACDAQVLECACQLETNRLYLMATGRLLGIVDLAGLLQAPYRPSARALDSAKSCLVRHVRRGDT